MERTHQVEVRLPHRIDVGEAAKYLLSVLDCDDWYVACQREHLLVIQLSQQGKHKYAVRFECSSPVEKAIYHGSKAWSLSVTPLGDAGDLTAAQVAQLKTGLGKLE